MMNLLRFQKQVFMEIGFINSLSFIRHQNPVLLILLVNHLHSILLLYETLKSVIK
jgi:hypothetical protein